MADGVNVDGEVYRIRTRISEQGSTIEKGWWVGRRDKRTRRQRWEQLDEDFSYDPEELDRRVTSPSQIRTILTRLPRQPARAVPRAQRSPQDAGLRQGRQPRRGDRAHRARGVRQGRRLLPEDHLPRRRRCRRT